MYMNVVSVGKPTFESSFTMTQMRANRKVQYCFHNSFLISNGGRVTVESQRSQVRKASYNPRINGFSVGAPRCVTAQWAVAT